MADYIQQARELLKKAKSSSAQRIGPATKGAIQGALPITQLFDKSSPAREYISGQVVNPIKQGIQQYKSLGVAQVVGGGFSATPMGAAWNVGSGVGTGVVESLRNKQYRPIQIAQNMYKSSTTPTSFATEGLGIKNPLLALGVDFIAGNPKEAFNKVSSLRNVENVGRMHFSLDKNTFDEIVQAEDMLRNPENWIGKINTPGAFNKKEMIKYIQSFGMDTVERISAKHLPDKQLNTLKSPEAKIRALVKLSQENRLANVPGMGFVGGETKDFTKVGDIPTGKPPTPKAPATGKYAFSVNLNKMNIPEEAKATINQVTNDINAELKAVKGKAMSSGEVLEAAKGADVLKNILPREKTLEATSAITRLRQTVASQASDPGVTPDFIDNIKVLSSYAADAGRTLKAFDIAADPTMTPQMKEKVVAELLKLGKSADDILAKAQGVDFNNPKQVTAFYRSFVKPQLGEILGEYRYINLLSSPKTHIVNAFSNALQAGILSPGTKLYTGSLDYFGSKLTGKQQQAYVSEVPAYYKGLLNSVGTALTESLEVLKGNRFVERPDVARIASDAKILKPLQVVPRALEASDMFFRTIIKAGEKEAILKRLTKQGKTLSSKTIEKMADDKAKYFVFREALDPSNKKGQGKLLSYIDQFTSSVYTLRKVPGVSWFIPFVQTPMNILKQGIEYSPLGVATLPGAANKTEQVGKALLGSTVFAGAAWAVQAGDSTWAAPTNEKDKEAFYASGRQPYSLKIGDQWVSYSRLGPLAYPIALASAIKYNTEQDPKAFSRSKMKQTSLALSGLAKFFSDQSYVQGLGDLVKTLQGDTAASKSLLTNIPTQLIPLEALVGWTARIVDPIYRKPAGVVDSIKTQIPGLSKSVEPYTNPAGLPSRRQNVPFNAVSPVTASPVSKGYEQYYQSRFNYRQFDTLEKQAKALVKEGRVEEAVSLIQKNRDIFQQGVAAKSANSKFTQLSEARNKVAADKRLTKEQKERVYALIEKQLQEISTVSNQNLSQ